MHLNFEGGNLLIKILTTLGSMLTIAFGAWHFTVPAKWQWYRYIDPSASELVLAVRAINVFFSLSLVLIGLANLIFLYVVPGKTPLAVMLALSGLLWGVRCVLQIVYPQGSMNPTLQYGMLITFLLVFLCFLISFLLLMRK
jgi:hypothetical protein